MKEPAACASQLCAAKQAMKLVHNQCLYSDKQLVKIQESPNLIPEGETPHAVTAFVYDALVDFVRPGDRITLVGASLGRVLCAASDVLPSAVLSLAGVAGMYRALPVRQNPRLRVVKSVLRTYIDVLHVIVNQKDIIFQGTPNLPVGDAAMPDTPRSSVASEQGSQVRASRCCAGRCHVLSFQGCRVEVEPRLQGDAGDMDTQDPFGLNNLARHNLVTKEDRMVRLGRQADIYEKLTASLAPSIWSMDDVKKGILCQLFGATVKVGSAFHGIVIHTCSFVRCIATATARRRA